MNTTNTNQQTVPNGTSVTKQSLKTKVAALLQPLQPLTARIKNVWMKIPEKFRKILRITGIVFSALLFLMIILSIVINIRNNAPVEVKPTPIVTFEPLPSGETITNPSRYATDSGVIKIEEELRNLEKELDNMQVNEVNLLPPRLDFDINFDK